MQVGEIRWLESPVRDDINRHSLENANTEQLIKTGIPTPAILTATV